MKLITVIMGENCENTIGMCLESVRDADEIIYLDGGSKDGTFETMKGVQMLSQGKIKTIHNKFNKYDSEAISKQRNFYLNYLKENFNNDDWVLILDSDEVLDTNGIQNIRNEIKNKLDNIGGAYSPQMIHLMYTLGFVDNTKEVHNVPNRLFKLGDAKEYPKGEHCILLADNNNFCKIDNIIIWHLGYLGGIYDVRKRYMQQYTRNNGHTQAFLNKWNLTHLKGEYPLKRINIESLPNHVLEHFGINPEELYFENRGQVELKHGIFVKQWNEFFKPKSVADFGCGRGLYMYFWEMCTKCEGYELSEYARLNKKCNSIIYQFKLGYNNITNGPYDLVTALDVLEHLEYDNLDIAIDTLIDASKKYILTSIPYKGTPNCNLDKTHLIKEDREWWAKHFRNRGLKEIPVPDHWIFKEQLMVFEK